MSTNKPTRTKKVLKTEKTESGSDLYLNKDLSHSEFKALLRRMDKAFEERRKEKKKKK